MEYKTEEQAIKLWCPMIRPLPLGDGESYSGITTRDLKGTRCLASGCGVWKWNGEANLVHSSWVRVEAIVLSAPPALKDFLAPRGEGWKPNGDPVPDEEGEAIWYQQYTRDTDPERVGCCGLIQGT